MSKLLEMNIVPETVIWREKGVKGVGSLQKWIHNKSAFRTSPTLEGTLAATFGHISERKVNKNAVSK